MHADDERAARIATRRSRPLLVPWLAEARPLDLSADLIAGVTLAAYAVPASLAYSSLAGLPPESGLYAYLVGGLAYALFGTSRQLAIGPTSSISILLGGSLVGLAAGNVSRSPEIAAFTALLVAAIGVIAWAVRFGHIASFVSHTILAGFKAGAALVIASTQVPKLFGISLGTASFFPQMRDLILHLGETHPLTLAVGGVGLLLLALGQRLFPARPVALVVVVLSIVVAAQADLGARGVALVGTLPAGLPRLALPELGFGEIPAVLPLALGCFLLAYIEGISAARTFAEQHRYEIDADRELLAIGIANLAAGLVHSYPAAGGMSQSAVNDKAGARSPLALVFASATIAAVLLFLTHFMGALPKPILGAVVLMAVKDLIDVREIRHLARVNKVEFRVALVSLLGVLLFGILEGLLLAAIFSLLMLLRWAANPHTAVLGRIPGTDRFGDLERHHKNVEMPGVLIFRVEGGLYYFNVEHVKECLLDLVATHPEPVEVVIFDLSSSPQIDLAGARMLAEVHDRLREDGIELELAEAHGSVRELLRAAGMEERFGKVDRRTTVAGLLEQRAAEADPRPSR